MSDQIERTIALRGIRILALWVGIVAVTLQVMSQVLTVPTGFGIEDYLGWARHGGDAQLLKEKECDRREPPSNILKECDPDPQLFKEWKRFGVGWVAIAYLVLDTVLFVPLYGALLIALTDKFMLAVGKDRALGLKGNKDISSHWKWLRRWSLLFAGTLMFLIGIDLIENFFGLIRLGSWYWAFVAFVAMICGISASTITQWWQDFREYLRWLNLPAVACVVVIWVVLSCLFLVSIKEIQFSPLVWAHQIKVWFVLIYLISLSALASAWFFGFFFDSKRTQDDGNKLVGDEEYEAQPVLNGYEGRATYSCLSAGLHFLVQPVSKGYEERAAFRRSFGGIILRSRYVLIALVIFVGLALVMDQGRDVLYSVASHELEISSILVLALSALGMSAFSFSCWLWSRSVSLIRSPDTPESMCPSTNDPARLSDRFAKDWARLLGLMPPVLFLLLCGATMRDAVWAGNSVLVWVLGSFSALATGFCLHFVFLHWRDTEKHFYNFQTFDDWHDDTYKNKNGLKNKKHRKYKFLGLVSPFWLPFFAIVCFFLSRTIPLIGDVPLIGNAPSTLISSMLFALTFWLSIFGWVSLNEERIAIPWVALLIVVAGAFGYVGWTQNHVIGPVANAISEFVWLFLPVVLAALLLALFTVFVAFNSTDHFEGLRHALSRIGLVNSRGCRSGGGRGLSSLCYWLR